MALKISLRWQQSPDWFYNLDKNTQISLIAEYRIENESNEQIKKRKDKIKQERLRKLIEAKGIQ